MLLVNIFYNEGINRFNSSVPGNSPNLSSVRGHMCIYLYFASDPALTYGSSGLVWCMAFNATFNTISATLWRSVLLVEVIGVPGENHRPIPSPLQTLSHNVVSSTLPHERDSNSKDFSDDRY